MELAPQTRASFRQSYTPNGSFAKPFRPPSQRLAISTRGVFAIRAVRRRSVIFFANKTEIYSGRHGAHIDTYVAHCNTILVRAMAAVKELFESVVEITGRAFPSEAAAREGLQTFQTTLGHDATPVESVIKRLFGRASVQEVSGENGNVVFKIFLHSEIADESITPAVLRGLRSGDFESIAHSLDMAPAELGSQAARANYVRYARDVFPDVRMAEEAAAAERALPASLAKDLRDFRPGTADEFLQAIKRDKDLNKLMGRLSEYIGKNGGARFKYVSTFFLLSGVAGGVTSVALALHEQAKRAAGCWRLYLDPVTKQLRGCKILHASCRNREANEGAACDRTPMSFNAEMCRGVAPDQDCARCDSTADPGSKQYIPRSMYLDTNDLYMCRPVASVGEMLGRMVADVPDLAHDVVVDVASTVSRVWNSVKYFLLAGGLTVIAILLMYAFIHTRLGGGIDRASDYGSASSLITADDEFRRKPPTVGTRRD